MTIFILQAMKPFKIQYVLAHGIKLSTFGGGLLLAAFVGWSCGAFSFWAVLAILASLPLGAIFGMFFFMPLINIICFFLNGGLFHKGDSVRILVGPHKNKVTQIYEVWNSRGQVRVDLGEETAKKVKDVFDDIQVCRERNSQIPFWKFFNTPARIIAICLILCGFGILILSATESKVVIAETGLAITWIGLMYFIKQLRW